MRSFVQNRCPCKWAMVILLVIAASGAGTRQSAATGLVFENFDVDPGWDQRNNRVIAPAPRTVTQSFGYRSTSHAGGSAGEIGGVVDRAPLTGAYYGKILAPLTFDAPLSFSGKVNILKATHTVGFTSSSDIFVGFFNADEQRWRPPNFLGFRLRGHNEPVPHVASLELSYGTSAWQADGTDWGVTIQPGELHDFELIYDPNVGAGRLQLKWDGTEILAFNMQSFHRTTNATLNRFGIFSNQLPGLPAGNTMEAYFDDLTVNGTLHNFSTNPGWEGVGNQVTFQDPHLYGTNDFGYSSTNYAGGSDGEMGGLIWRVEDFEEDLQAYYADDIGTLTLADRLSARGTIVAERFSIDAGLMLGWFNSADQDWPPSNFVGVYLDSLSDTGRLFTPMYGTSTGSTQFARDPWLLIPPDGVPREWSIEYDPAAGAGRGAITVTLDGTSKTLVLSSGHKAQGATLDRFGIFNMQDNNGKHSVVYLDDIVYTSSRAPEPGDYNHNGVIDGADYVVWRDSVGQAVTTGSGADGDFNGVVDQEDYQVWRRNFGKTVASSGLNSSTHVPEPATCMLLSLISTAAILGYRNERRAIIAIVKNRQACLPNAADGTVVINRRFSTDDRRSAERLSCRPPPGTPAHAPARRLWPVSRIR